MFTLHQTQDESCPMCEGLLGVKPSIHLSVHLPCERLPATTKSHKENMDFPKSVVRSGGWGKVITSFQLHQLP